MMHCTRPGRYHWIARGLVALGFAGLIGLWWAPASRAATMTISLRSGNGSAGGPDALITVLDAGGKRFGSLLTPADFAAADAGPPATIVTPWTYWLGTLPCDSAAQWIAVDVTRPAHGALYAIPFTVPQGCCAGQATVQLCWAVDSRLGDTVNINPEGAYLNGVPIPRSNGGNALHQRQLPPLDVTGLIHCGRNVLYLYVVDTDLGKAGVIFHADIATDCVVPTKETTWGAIKALYGE